MTEQFKKCCAEGDIEAAASIVEGQTIEAAKGLVSWPVIVNMLIGLILAVWRNSAAASEDAPSGRARRRS